ADPGGHGQVAVVQGTDTVEGTTGMDGQSARNGQVTLDAMDAAIDAAVNVDPSPEFVARVRTRLAEQRAPRRWTLRHAIVCSAAAAGLSILAFVARPTGRPPTPPVGQPTVSSTAPSAAAPSLERTGAKDGAAGGPPTMR